jgi:hypothetical protein
MGCGSSKKTDVVATTSRTIASTSQQPSTSQTPTEPATEPETERAADPAKEPAPRKERMPRGNVLKYSNWLKRFHRLSTTDAGPNPGNEGLDLGSVPFPLQDGVEPHDLTPWRDEDTRIVVQKVEQRVDPYFWDFSDNAQRKADEYYQELLARDRTGRLEFSPASETLTPYPSYWRQGTVWTDRPVPVNPASVDEYFRNHLRSNYGRWYGNSGMIVPVGPAWLPLPDGVVGRDECTYEQLETWGKRSRRQDLDDPERMRKRRVELNRRFLELYPHKYQKEPQQQAEEVEENELQPWLGWADRMEESWQTFQRLLVVNSNESKNEETHALTRTTTLII